MTEKKTTLAELLKLPAPQRLSDESRKKLIRYFDVECDTPTIIRTSLRKSPIDDFERGRLSARVEAAEVFRGIVANEDAGDFFDPSSADLFAKVLRDADVNLCVELVVAEKPISEYNRGRAYFMCEITEKLTSDEGVHQLTKGIY